MASLGIVFIAIAIGIVLVLLAIRKLLATRGSGRLAQLAFRRAHGSEICHLLDGRLDAMRGSPWIDIQFAGRNARLVAAPVDGRLQAGVQLIDWRIPVQVWFTSGDPDETDVPEGIDVDRVMELVYQLRAADVVSLVNGSDDPEVPHVLRLNFDRVTELPGRLALVTPILGDLERLAAPS